MEYVLCIVFNYDGSKVLLQHKNRSKFKGKWNFPGGKVNKNENPYHANIRELFEETNITERDLVNDGCIEIANINLHYDCCTDQDNCILHVYAGYVALEKCVIQKESEKLEWFDVDEILNTLVTDNKFAGNGNLQYFLNIAHIHLFENGEFFK